MAEFRFQYAVKFICTSNLPGTSQTTTSFQPGSYQTAVNIHNPNDDTIRFRMKLANAQSGDVSDFVFDGLKPDQATKVDCGQLQRFPPVPIHGFEGFLVIECDQSLDVVAIYTAGYNGGVTSIDVEYVRERDWAVKG